jgi:hypothetical protein
MLILQVLLLNPYFDYDLDLNMKNEREIMKMESTLRTYDKLSQRFLNSRNCLVRIYIVDAYNVQSRDNDSPSDPYIKLVLGKQVINERENYQNNTENPKFYKQFDFNVTFPGDSILELQLWV